MNVPPLNDALWNRVRANQVRRERLRLIQNGNIRPSWGMQPQLMVKDASGSWVPGLKTLVGHVNGDIR